MLIPWSYIINICYFPIVECLCSCLSICKTYHKYVYISPNIGTSSTVHNILFYILVLLALIDKDKRNCGHRNKYITFISFNLNHIMPDCSPFEYE